MRRLAVALVVLAAGCGGGDERPRDAAEVIRGDLDVSYFWVLRGDRAEIDRGTLLLNAFVVDDGFPGTQVRLAEEAAEGGELARLSTDGALTVYLLRGDGGEELGTERAEVAGWTARADSQLELDRMLTDDPKRSLARLPDFRRDAEGIIRRDAVVAFWDPGSGAAAMYRDGDVFTSDARGYMGSAADFERIDLRRLVRLAPPDAPLVFASGASQGDPQLGVPLMYGAAPDFADQLYDRARGPAVVWMTADGHLTAAAPDGRILLTSEKAATRARPHALPEWFDDRVPPSAVRVVHADMPRLAKAATRLALGTGQRPPHVELALARRLESVLLWDVVEGNAIRSRGLYVLRSPLAPRYPQPP